MTAEERERKIKATLEERAGYQARGLDDRVAACNEELARLGAEGEAPVKRATRRRKGTS